MRYGILADIHANLRAFEAVLEDIDGMGGAEEIWCLGDIIGYGPDPHECLELLRQHRHLCVAGNHDWAAIGKIDVSDFNPDAAAANIWTSAQLSQEDREYLENLPLRLSQGGFTLVHGSPREPIWEYVLSPISARDNFAHFDTPYCLIGHSHVPFLFEAGAAKTPAILKELPSQLHLGQKRLIINPGGVGQPRDGDPRASYTLYDSQTKTIHHRRIPYDIAATQRKMLDLGLPPRLADRLSLGW
jgi:diadenosine tetraphosphatase ApaH/serine/threonine PP2A family protein phosphatase